MRKRSASRSRLGSEGSIRITEAAFRIRFGIDGLHVSVKGERRSIGGAPASG
jgi:hypothetical protein